MALGYSSQTETSLSSASGLQYSQDYLLFEGLEHQGQDGFEYPRSLDC